MPYHIIDVNTNQPYSVTWSDGTASGATYVCDSANEAMDAARQLTDEFPGSKWRIKRIKDTNWHQREQNKFDTNIYQPLPWSTVSWWLYNSSIHQYHFAHVSLTEPGKIAYTESNEKGMDNIQTQIKPGRYLEKYFGGKIAPEWDIDIQYNVGMFINLYEPKPLHFANTEDEIQDIYEHGPRSCMSSEAYRARQGWGWNGEDGAWPLDTHACRVYAAGDLQLAYLLQDDNDPMSDIIARALVWPARKTHSRCYGNDSRMQASLTSAGYYSAAPLGAKLLRIPIEDTYKFVCPYIDAGPKSGQGSLAVEDKVDHLVICEPRRVGVYRAGNTSGASSGKMDAYGREINQADQHCDRCADDGVETKPVYSDGSCNYMRWCVECRDDGRTFFCAHDDRYYNVDYVDSVEMACGDYWSQKAFNSVGFVCQGSGLRYPRSERVPMADDTLWSIEYYRKNGFCCTNSGQHYPITERVVMASGDAISKTSFATNGYVCPECGKNKYISDRHPTLLICYACAGKTASLPLNTPTQPTRDIDVPSPPLLETVDEIDDPEVDDEEEYYAEVDDLETQEE